MKKYQWVVKDVISEPLSHEQIKAIINLKIARIILQLEKNKCLL